MGHQPLGFYFVHLRSILFSYFRFVQQSFDRDLYGILRLQRLNKVMETKQIKNNNAMHFFFPALQNSICFEFWNGSNLWNLFVSMQALSTLHVHGCFTLMMITTLMFTNKMFTMQESMERHTHEGAGDLYYIGRQMTDSGRIQSRVHVGHRVHEQYMNQDSKVRILLLLQPPSI